MKVQDMKALKALRNGVQGGSPVADTRKSPSSPDASFSKQLQHVSSLKAESLSFSRHAEKRLSERGISIDEARMGELNNAVEQARKKGAKDVAIIGREGIFIVNVEHNVVVTTMGEEDMKNRIFTNIDSAVLM